MTKHDTVRYEMLVRVRGFGEAHRDAFPEASVGGQAFAAVSAAVLQLGQHAISKMAAASEGRRTKALKRSALLDRLTTIERTARIVADGKPGFADGFQVPRRKSDQAVLTAGKVFAQNAEPLAREFVAHGLPETFLAELNAQVEQFDQSLRRRDAGRSEQTAAKAGIDLALASGLAAVRKLDIIVTNQFQNDSVTLAVWERDRRLDHWRSRKSASVTVDDTDTPEIPAPVSPAKPSPESAPAPVAADDDQPAAEAALKVAS